MISELPTVDVAVEDALPIRILAGDDEVFCYATYLGSSEGMKLVWGSAEAGQPLLALGEFQRSDVTPTALDVDGALVAVGVVDETTGTKSWMLVDFTDPGAPVESSRTPVGDWVTGIALSDGLACVAAGSAGLTLFDVSDPTTPTASASLPDLVSASDVVECDGTWYCSGVTGFMFDLSAVVRAYDFSVPTAPVMTAQYSSYGGPGGYAFSDLATRDGVLAACTTQYVEDYLGSYSYVWSLRVLDTAVPGALTGLATFSFGTEPMAAPAVGAGTIYCPVNGVVTYFEPVDDSWTEVFRQASGAGDNSIETIGDRILGCDGTRVMEFSGPLTVLSPVIALTGGSAAYDIGLSGNHALVSYHHLGGSSPGDQENWWITVYDISDPANPSEVRSVSHQYPIPMNELVIQGDLVHTDAGTFDWRTGEFLGDALSMPRRACLGDGVMYALQYNGLRIYDLIDPAHPAEAGLLLDGQSLDEVVVAGGTMYVFGDQLWIFDLYDPTVPTLSATATLPSRVHGASADKGRLMLAMEDGLRIFDLWGQTQASHLAVGPCYDVVDAGSEAYVASADLGLAYVDVSSPSAPTLLGNVAYGTPGKRVAAHPQVLLSLQPGLTVSLYDCATVAVEDDAPPPAEIIRNLRLAPARPNPFNPSTTLEFELVRPGPVRLAIHDAAGRLVRTLVEENRSIGVHRARWNGRDDSGSTVAAGIYFAKLRTDAGAEVRKLVMLK